MDKNNFMDKIEARNIRLLNTNNFSKEVVQQLIDKLNSEQVAITNNAAIVPGTVKLVDGYIEANVNSINNNKMVKYASIINDILLAPIP